ncbi:MAG TPA: flavin oxidoreductase/NADH oxidase [Clostridiaceae bacterium]|nr:flavin oxidoreductase/NADH oxidase [Clostridiaceae bacterium]
MEFKEFGYKNLDEIKEDIKNMNLNLHFSDNLELLKRKVTIDHVTIPNSIAFHPMEGTDGNYDGSPHELTIRRYERFSRGGAGLLWFEAVAVVKEGRVCPRQLWITKDNVNEFRKLHDMVVNNAQNEFGRDFRPVCIMQLTHSGRFSKPEGPPAPIIAYHNPYLDQTRKIDENTPVVDDDYLERLEEKFEEAAVLAKEAGFDGVDIKACHRYLNSELLGGFVRKGKYGGDFEGRTRFLLNVVDRIKQRLGKDFIVATRLNIYDGIPYPYGWGVDKDDYRKPDFTEPIKLVKILYEKGVKLINITMGTPYHNPHVNRPYDKGSYIPDEHPLEGVARLVNGAGVIQKAFPEIKVVGTGYSWLREFSPYLAAGTLEQGLATLIGYGRETFAYPDFPKDIFTTGAMKKEKCCIACGKCAEIMRSGGPTGCAVRDAKVYAPIYKQYCVK